MHAPITMFGVHCLANKGLIDTTHLSGSCRKEERGRNDEFVQVKTDDAWRLASLCLAISEIRHSIVVSKEQRYTN